MSSESQSGRWRTDKVVSVSVGSYDKVEFSSHALDRIKERGVSEAQVIEVLRNPKKKGLPTQVGRQRYRGAKSRRGWLDVVIEERADRIRVVTVMVLE